MLNKNKQLNNSSSDYYTTNTTDDDNMLTRNEDDRKSHDTDRNSSDMFYRFLEIIFLIIEYIIYNAIPILVSALLIIILIGCIFYSKNIPIAIGIGILLIFNFIGFRNLGYFRNPNEYK